MTHQRNEEKKDNSGETTPALLMNQRQWVLDVVKQLWAKPEREHQYFALEFLKENLNLMDESFLLELEVLITTKSWWDTVDMIASNVLGPFAQAYPKQTLPRIEQWIFVTPSVSNENDSRKSDLSGNMWLRRSAILFQLKYKKQTDHQLLFRYCKACAEESEFFIRKAIGWSLREYAKTDPQQVLDFVNQHKHILSPLSQKEALKHL